MQHAIANITFYPQHMSSAVSATSLVETIAAQMRADGNDGKTGYKDTGMFARDLKDHIGTGTYTLLTQEQQFHIATEIDSTLRLCHDTLPHPDLPILIFIYPRLSDDTDDVGCGGVRAFSAGYSLHLFIDPRSFTAKGIRETVAHEWNRLVYYRYHTGECTMLERMCMEGFAEIFREELVGGDPAPWSTALSKEDALTQLETIKPLLSRTDDDTYQDLFLSDIHYEKWTGYSIGYWLAKEYRAKHGDMSWPEVVKNNYRAHLLT